MTIVRRTNPFGEMLSLRQAMDRLFEDSFIHRDPNWGEHQLALDIRTTGDELVVEAALPGVKQEDVQISVLGDTLSISGSHRDETRGDEEGYTYREIRRGSFSRTVTLPANLRTEDATASFDNGLLTLRFPKAAEARPRPIPISSGAAPSNSHAIEQSSETDEQSDENPA